MKYKLLGKSTLSISEISLGCMSLKGGDKENIALIHSTLDAGINFFDTADIYDQGRNEQLLGQAFKRRRNSAIIATKAGNVLRQDGSGLDWNPSGEHIIHAVEESLRRLQTDYIDLYQLHGGTITDNIDETIEAFERLQQQGKILFYGISSIRPNVIRQYVERSRIVSVMLQYSLLDRRAEETVFDLLMANEIGILARGALAQGLLTGKTIKAYLDHSEKGVSDVAVAVKELSNQERPPAQTALRYVLQKTAVTSVVTGTGKKEQLDLAVGSATAPMLSSTEIDYLEKSGIRNYYTLHR